MKQSEIIALAKDLPLDILAQNLTPSLLKGLSREKKFLVYVYLRWVNAAKDSCGPVYISQAHKNHSSHIRALNSYTETSSKVSL